MPKYLLPCECGESVLVETRQAGETITCKCGLSLDVPTMRAIRELEVHESGEPATTKPKAEWSPLRGIAFGGGVILILIGLGLFGRGYSVTRLMERDLETVRSALNVEYERFQHDVEHVTAEQALDLWFAIRKSGLSPREKNPFVLARIHGAKMRTMMISGGIVGAVGLALSIGAALSSSLARPKHA